MLHNQLTATCYVRVVPFPFFIAYTKCQIVPLFLPLSLSLSLSPLLSLKQVPLSVEPQDHSAYASLSQTISDDTDLTKDGCVHLLEKRDILSDKFVVDLQIYSCSILCARRQYFGSKGCISVFSQVKIADSVLPITSSVVRGVLFKVL